jgi:hypothetical protein
MNGCLVLAVQCDGREITTVEGLADADGVMLAVEHDVVNNAGLVDTHVEPATEASKSLYAAPGDPAAAVPRAGQPQPADADAGPGRGPRAVESAMNQLAEVVGVDPLDLRPPPWPPPCTTRSGCGCATSRSCRGRCSAPESARKLTSGGPGSLVGGPAVDR